MITPIAHDDATSDCDLYTNFLNEDDLRNDPVFQVFLDKYPDVRFYNTILESLPPLGVYSFDYFKNNDDRLAEANLVVTTDECNLIEDYLLTLPSGDHHFYHDTAFPYGAPNDDMQLYSIDEITVMVRNLLDDDVVTCDDPQTLHSNIRGEYVCINPESVSKLTDRGYLI